MIRTIRIQDLGPHVDTTLHVRPKGPTTISGPSECGKSRLVDAVLFALLGTGADGKPLSAAHIHTGEKRASVTLTTAKGAVIYRSMSLSRGTKREVDNEPYSTESAFAEVIGPFAKRLPGNVSALQLILAPMSWVALANGKLGGMPLRNVLASLAPGSDLDEVTRLMQEAGHEMREGESIALKAVEKARAEANKGKSEAVGALNAAIARKVDVPPETDAAATKSAQGIIGAAAEWKAYSADYQRHGSQSLARHAAVCVLEEWTTNTTELGKRPTGNADAISQANIEAREAEAAARSAAESLRVAIKNLDGLRNEPQWEDVALEKALANGHAAGAALERAEKHGDTCPNCSRPGWEEAAAKIAELQAAKDTCRDAYRVALQGSKARTDAADEARAEAIDEAAAEVDRLTINRDDTHRASVLKSDALISAKGSDPAAQWLSSRQALGNRPPEPPAAPTAPTVPDGVAPTPEQVRDAQAAIRDADQNAGARKQALKQQATAERTREAAIATHATATAEATRAAALVDAVRAAPGARLEKGIEALGDTGPVSFVVPESGAIEVRIDGRLWSVASTGRKVYADAMFRAGLRRALKMRYVPIVVDELQSWSGDAPPIPGAVWFLRTVKGSLKSDAPT